MGDKAKHDYNVCDIGMEIDGDEYHKPIPAPIADGEMPAGYLTIMCSRCGQTTGYPMPPADEIDWG